MHEKVNAELSIVTGLAQNPFSCTKKITIVLAVPPKDIFNFKLIRFVESPIQHCSCSARAYLYFMHKYWAHSCFHQNACVSFGFLAIVSFGI